MAKVHLPVVEPGSMQSSLRSDGSRNWVQPADVTGRFSRARKLVFVLLIAWWAILPWLRVDGRPALQLDVEHRRFFLFGATLNAQDTYLLFFLLTGIGFSLILVTTLLGRVWCGWSCPQTVFLEGMFRPLERILEGTREARIRRDAGPWTLDKTVRKTVKHLAFVVLAAFVAHVFVGYFVSTKALFQMMRRSPGEHPETFAWAFALTAIFYGNFAWFREQLCIGLCPYGRLQSVLIDKDSLVVGYDTQRGEPRGKAKDTSTKHGDCIDCKRCVVVCPTGIDIRNGLQLDCVACTACIDACDEIMVKVGKPVGLVRYDSASGFEGAGKKLLRPRVFVYVALMVIGAIVATVSFRRRTDFEANLLRVQGIPFVVEGPLVKNAFTIHLVNKSSQKMRYLIEPEASAGLVFDIPLADPEVESMSGITLPVTITTARAGFVQRGIRIKIRNVTTGKSEVMAAGTLLGPMGGL
ncbi:MAG: cytochrome c oxidase accessory protein CcoG [Myxococcales bacterium]|nr:cytochrome c oxidase accessory protein CcoG [Myxococcales bacterium]